MFFDQVNINSITVAGTSVKFSDDPVRNLGVIFDSQLSMKPHIRSVVKSGYFHLRNISLARKQLTKDATRSLTEALVLSRLDYGNSLLSGISDELLQKLQVLQNSAARLVTKTPRRAHISPVLRELHWLPVRARIYFKVLYLVFKALHAEAPQYLSELIHTYVPPRSLRSQNKGMLTEPVVELSQT